MASLLTPFLIRLEEPAPLDVLGPPWSTKVRLGLQGSQVAPGAVSRALLGTMVSLGFSGVGVDDVPYERLGGPGPEARRGLSLAQRVYLTYIPKRA